MKPDLSPRQRMRLAMLQGLEDRVHHLHGLVEKFAAARENHDMLAQPIRRAFGQFKLDLTAVGLDQMAQLAAGMEIAARRGGSPMTKSRILRDGVGSLRSQLELEQRAVLASVEEERSSSDAEPGPDPTAEK